MHELTNEISSYYKFYSVDSYVSGLIGPYSVSYFTYTGCHKSYLWFTTGFLGYKDRQSCLWFLQKTWNTVFFWQPSYKVQYWTISQKIAKTFHVCHTISYKPSKSWYTLFEGKVWTRKLQNDVGKEREGGDQESGWCTATGQIWCESSPLLLLYLTSYKGVTNV